MGFFYGLREEEYDREYDDRELVRRIYEYFRPHGKRVFIIAFVTVLTSLLTVVPRIVVAEGLDRLVGNVDSVFGGEQFRHRRQFDCRIVLFSLDVGCCAVRQRSGSLDIRRHLGDLVFDRLEIPDLLSELFAFVRVLDRGIERALCGTDRL